MNGEFLHAMRCFSAVSKSARRRPVACSLCEEARMASSTQVPAGTTSAGEAYDRKLAAEAVRKLARGASLTVQE